MSCLSTKEKLRQLDHDSALSILHDDEYGRIILLVMCIKGRLTKMINLELIGPSLYSVINRPNKLHVDQMLNLLVEETGAFRMGDVVLFTDEVRTIIKLTHGITIRKT